MTTRALSPKTNKAGPAVSTSVDAIFHGQPKDVLWKSLNVPILDWNDVGIDCFLGRGAFTHVHKGKIKHRKTSRKKTMSSIESTVAMSQSSSSLISVNSSSSSIESIPLEDDPPLTTGKPQSVDSELSWLSPSQSSQRKRPSPSSSNKSLCAIKCINPTKTKRKEALVSASNDLLNEAILLSQLVPNEHIVNFLGILPQGDDEEENEEGGSCQKKVVQDYVLVLECLDETLSARLKRWRKEQLQMQKQQQEIWMAQELVLEQGSRTNSHQQQHPNAPMGRRRLGTRARNLWRRWNNNGLIAPRPAQSAPRRGRWGRLIHRRGQAPQSPAPETTPHDNSTRAEDYRELVNAETNEFRFKQMNQRIHEIALGIVAGMKHMHDHQIVHRDLKPQNIGFDLETQTVKLFDFGLARQLPYDVQTATAAMYYSSRRRSSLGSSTGRRRSNSIGSGTGGRPNSIGSGARRRSNSIGNRRRSNSIGSRRQSNGSSTGGGDHSVPPNPTVGEVVGTWRYMAPETMRSMGSDYASDMFSFAIMWSEICTLQRPYFQDDDEEEDELIHPATATSKQRSSEKAKKNRYGPYENWNHLKSCILEEGHRPNLQSMPKHKSTSDMQMWINQCWDAEPYRRPTFDSLHQLLNHYCKENPSGLATI